MHTFSAKIVHIDIPKSGGLLESKRIHGLAEQYYIWTAAHNPASTIGTIRDKPGFGVELNPDVGSKHLAPGETWWG